MNSINTFSLSLQKQIENQNILFDSEINRAFNELNFRTLLNRSGITKKKGYATVTLLFLVVLLPFLKRRLSDFWNSNYIKNQINAQKDVYYRFLNHERFNWRKLLYLAALKVINFSDDIPLRRKVLIADDTVIAKSGKDMELVSYHFDHKTKRSILGNQCLQLGYHNGINFSRWMWHLIHPADAPTIESEILINEPMDGAGVKKHLAKRPPHLYRWLTGHGKPELMPPLFCLIAGLPMMMLSVKYATAAIMLSAV